MRRDEKKAFHRGSICLLSAIAALYIGKPGVKPNAVSANPISDNAMPTASSAIALKIDKLRNSDSHWIEIDLSEQHLFAWKGRTQAFSAVISTRKVDTPTYPGVYTIQRKYARDRMTGDDYDVPNVPNVLYFDRGYALHGAYWHNNFGTPMSHGCVNLPLGNAQWLFNWAQIGTPVIIHQ